MWLTLKRLARLLTPKPRRKILLDELVAALPTEQQDQARAVRDASPKPVFPTLPYTEGRIEWIMLHEHCTTGQMDPSVLRRMKDIDLEYLAAAPHAEFYRLDSAPTSHEEQQAVELRLAKLHANVTRATRELQRRYTVRIGVSVAVLSIVVGTATSRLL